MENLFVVSIGNNSCTVANVLPSAHFRRHTIRDVNVRCSIPLAQRRVSSAARRNASIEIFTWPASHSSIVVLCLSPLHNYGCSLSIIFPIQSSGMFMLPQAILKCWTFSMHESPFNEQKRITSSRRRWTHSSQKWLLKAALVDPFCNFCEPALLMLQLFDCVQKPAHRIYIEQQIPRAWTRLNKNIEIIP